MLMTLRRLLSLTRTRCARGGGSAAPAGPPRGRGSTRPAAATPGGPARVETMERRQLLSAAAVTAFAPPASAAAEPGVPGPTLVSEQLVGGDPRNVQGIVLTFSEPLDEASAEDLRNYRVGRRTDRRQRFADEFDNDDNNGRRRGRGLIRFESAVYDPAALTVTLTARDPFDILRRFRTIRVLGRDERGVRNAAGSPLDGDNDGTAGGDAVERFTFTRAKRVRYGERDGDNVALSLSGPGRLWVLRKTAEGRVLSRGEAVRVYLDRTDPSASVLTGRVRGEGPGIATIGQVVNAASADVRIAADPAFQIGQLIP
jgi:hypothetical protein